MMTSKMMTMTMTMRRRLAPRTSYVSLTFSEEPHADLDVNRIRTTVLLRDAARAVPEAPKALTQRCVSSSKGRLTRSV
jgi:hypothetical protein